MCRDKSESTIIKNKFIIESLYEEQIDELNLSMEHLSLLFLYKDKVRASDLFNADDENIRYIKTIASEFVNAGNMPKLLEFVNMMEGYQQKILMTFMIYKELMKNIETSFVPQIKALVMELIAMPEFNSLSCYCKDNFETMKCVLDILEMAKFEDSSSMLPEVKTPPKDSTLKKLDCITKDINELKASLLELSGEASNNMKAFNIKDIHAKIEDDWKIKIAGLTLNVQNNFMELIKIGLTIRDSGNIICISQKKIDVLKSMLPEVVRNLTLNEISLGKTDDNILYASIDGTTFVSPMLKRQNVACDIDGLPLYGEGWRLEMTDDLSVHIKNIFTDDYLYATQLKHTVGGYHRQVSMGLLLRGSEYKWTMTLKKNDGNEFAIQNCNYFPEYLVSCYSSCKIQENLCISTCKFNEDDDYNLWKTVDPKIC